MIVLYPIILGFLLGYILGGRIRYLTQHTLYWKLAAILAFVIQIVIFSDIPLLQAFSDTVSVILHYVSYLLLLIFIFRNIKTTGFALIGAGILLNLLAVFLIDNQTLLPWLGDIFYLPSWIPFSNAFSIGDVIIAAGIIIYLLFNMKPAKTSGKYAYYVNMYRKR
jgi:hypothetical protein